MFRAMVCFWGWVCPLGLVPRLSTRMRSRGLLETGPKSGRLGLQPKTTAHTSGLEGELSSSSHLQRGSRCRGIVLLFSSF